METQAIYLTNQEVKIMGQLKSRVPDLIASKGWDTKTFTAHCMLAGISSDTAYRLARGDTNFRPETLRVAAGVLGVNSISDIVDFNNGKH